MNHKKSFDMHNKGLAPTLIHILNAPSLLKPLQNKKGQKKIPDAQFSVPFSQLPAVKKDTENCAPVLFCDDFSNLC